MHCVRFFYKFFSWLQKYSEKKVNQLEQRISYIKLTKTIKKNWGLTRYIETENGTIILVKKDQCDSNLEELLMNRKNLDNAMNYMNIPKPSFEYTSITIDPGSISNNYLQSVLKNSDNKIQLSSGTSLEQSPSKVEECPPKPDKSTHSAKIYARKTNNFGQ